MLEEEWLGVVLVCVRVQGFLVHIVGFASDCGFVNLQLLGVNQDTVGWNCLASFDQDHISNDQLLHTDSVGDPIPDHNTRRHI